MFGKKQKKYTKFTLDYYVVYLYFISLMFFLMVVSWVDFLKIIPSVE
ncbi:hypothetical protein VIBNISO65_1530077 [Vibrio nigripulchritudo SO65]|nr:hypothetical protein VIBNIAM115_450077 [Vibrio nigripulchritudo AM115]CCN44631.1 hypothetical protein VIBNIFTn2_860077 [Vibrio nigripulchritudo FTn2]CCN66507.1 hypothetical protein VIBNIPon4_570006 [Vibrio nigripulchritudo POn4]CCN76226.1 hypothetical protein VIBNISO65_1530077 [Vibrio nigripulchritudo SO65]